MAFVYIGRIKNAWRSIAPRVMMMMGYQSPFAAACWSWVKPKVKKEVRDARATKKKNTAPRAIIIARWRCGVGARSSACVRVRVLLLLCGVLAVCFAWLPPRAVVSLALRAPPLPKKPASCCPSCARKHKHAARRGAVA